jgi:molybdopterin-guanine dinucleotide biosynthesis protein A
MLVGVRPPGAGTKAGPTRRRQPPSHGGVAGILLTGGASRRMGFDKASLVVGGVPLAAHLASMLAEVAAPVVEVGPGRSGAPWVQEDPPGSGPLVAVGAGYEALLQRGHRGPALVLACDLPRLDTALLGLVAGWPGTCSVVPVWAGRPQPLCARWSAEDLGAVGAMVAAGARSMRPLLERAGVVLVDEPLWSAVTGPESLADVDRPEDLERLGISPPHSRP